MNESASVMKKNDKWIPWLFVLFFAVILIVDGTFVTIAIRTQTGLVTNGAYEKGLAYNKTLKSAADQEKMNIKQKAIFNNGILSWHLTTKEGRPIKDAVTRARMFRAAQDGDDFTVSLEASGDGIYNSQPSFPARGLWTARLEAQWQERDSESMIFRTTLNLIVR